MALVIVQTKSTQKWYFLDSKPILKNFPTLFLSPIPSYAKNWVKMVPKQVFTCGGFKSPPPHLMSIPEAPSCRVKKNIVVSSLIHPCNMSVTYNFYYL